MVQDCGAQPLGIVALISPLVGLIVGYVGVQQLVLVGVDEGGINPELYGSQTVSALRCSRP